MRENYGELNIGDWNRFVLGQSGSFLQSWEWGEFQEKVGRRAVRLANDNWLVHFIEISLPFGKKYWYCPRGPIVSGQISSTICQEIIEEAKKTADKNVMFFRVCPEWPADLELAAKFEILGLKKLRYDIEPAQTLILDIFQSEKGLLAQMHTKWRYNIGLARKKGVKAKIVNAEEADFEKYFEDFWRLNQQTAKRQKIRLHEKEYYKKQLAINNQQFQCVLFVAEHKKKTVAANIVIFFGKCATYSHGASDNELRDLMAPHLLQWEQIKMAKKIGCTKYDFRGIDEKKWPGITRFKLGFGGESVKYIGTWDYALDKKWYLVYRGVQKFRR
jgi:peptidoglycan pentaglycine glycine transferase (the first glycine)